MDFFQVLEGGDGLADGEARVLGQVGDEHGDRRGGVAGEVLGESCSPARRLTETVSKGMDLRPRAMRRRAEQEERK